MHHIINYHFKTVPCKPFTFHCYNGKRGFHYISISRNKKEKLHVMTLKTKGNDFLLKCLLLWLSLALMLALIFMLISMLLFHSSPHPFV